MLLDPEGSRSLDVSGVRLPPLQECFQNAAADVACLVGADGEDPVDDPFGEVTLLYAKLEHVILSLFYGRPSAFAEVQRSTIALNGAFFNTQRMLTQYLRNAYFPTNG